MGLFSRKSASASVSAPTAPSDQYRLKATGQRVTLLEDLGGGEVRIAMDTAHTTRGDIVSARDITPA
ncbi:hypothetical protein OH791_33675 [Streptomyces anulatus]|uniref:hypothetical protein n=1 Tax=Streptomyces anulatus TaxID=1892 RepID=UPI00386BBBDE|nr:hypothetical protein OH791_33675 [Streptomyces anulatus]